MNSYWFERGNAGTFVPCFVYRGLEIRCKERPTTVLEALTIARKSLTAAEVPNT